MGIYIRKYLRYLNIKFKTIHVIDNYYWRRAFAHLLYTVISDVSTFK